ncbi:MAG: serine/threonine-protein kinase, partial [Pirellula sp.]
MNRPTIDEIIYKYEEAVKAGVPPERERLFADNPDFADSLRRYFDDQEGFDFMVHGRAGNQPSGPNSVLQHGGIESSDRAWLLKNANPNNPISTGSFPSSEPEDETRKYAPRYQESMQIGPYTLLELIAVGGMGEVWMAEQTTPVRRYVALKFTRSDSDSKNVLARFDAERQALARMDHPNIARVFDAGTAPDDQPYFAMELVRGIPIVEYCNSNQLSIVERLRIFADVCKGVQHAHQQGIMHRDLKPPNILVTQYDGRPVPKVIDFGLAKALRDYERLTDKLVFTRYGEFVGTPLYTSPEQFERNDLEVDTRTDIYSLGVILYELLTGSTPIDPSLFINDKLRFHQELTKIDPQFPSVRLSSTRDRIVDISLQRKTNPRKLAKALRGELDWIVMKALEKDRIRRYENASDFAADVQRFLINEPVVARPASLNYRFRKFVSRNLGLSIGIAAVAGLLIAGTTISSWFAVQAIDARKSAEAKQLQVGSQLDLILAILSDINPAGSPLDDVELRERLGQNIRKSIAAIEAVPDSGDNSKLRLFDVLQNTLGALGFPQDALRVAEAAVKHTRDSNIDKLSRLNVDINLANALAAMHRYEDAISILEPSALNAETLSGKDSKIAIKANLSLGFAYSQASKTRESVEIYDKLIPMLKQRGELTSELCEALHDSGYAYLSHGDTDRGIESFRQSLESATEQYGDEHATTNNARMNLGNQISSLGKHHEARALLERAYQVGLKLYGLRSSRSAATLNALLVACGRFNGDPEFLVRMKELLPVSQETYQYLVAGYGPNHPVTLSIFNNLATAYGLAGELEKCIQLHREHCASLERLYGPED